VSHMLLGYLLDTYKSPRLTMPQLAEVLQRNAKGVANEACRPDFPIRTYMDAGRRWADVRDVIEYLDRKRADSEATRGEVERNA